jgi:hypothetical protein
VIHRALLLAIVVLAPFAGAFAQDDTAHHRAAYAEINAALPRMKKVTATFKDDPIEFALTGWLQDGEVKKIVAINNTDEGEEEYYLEKEAPLFVYSTYRAGAGRGAKVEERVYFRDSRIVKWLTNEKSAPVLHGEDYQSNTERLVGNTQRFVAALKKGKSLTQTAAATRTVEGTFIGIEQGDYAHWQMRTKSGEDVSLFILRPDASVEKIIENPKSYRGRPCRVSVKKTTENIPEAGRKMEVEQIVSVEWLGKK